MQSPNEVVLKAAEIATELHAGQKDKAGFPYILHPQRVAEMVRLSGGNWAQEAAAAGFTTSSKTPRARLRTSCAVTSQPSWSHWWRSSPSGHRATETYLLNVQPLLRRVEIKVCDIHDNLSPVRLCYLPLADQAKLVASTASISLHCPAQPTRRHRAHTDRHTPRTRSAS